MNPRHILLVEDNPDDEVLSLRALHRQNVAERVDVVRDGAEALEYLFGAARAARPGEPFPGLVLLDLKLPKIDGLDVLRRIRSEARTRFLPVVVLTTSDELRDVQESYRLGANSYIRKPIDFRGFSAAIANMGRYWLSLNHPPPAADAL